MSCLAVGVRAEESVSFTREVKPLLARRCFACHGPDEAEGGLALHEQSSARAELDSGAFAIVPGDPESSELLARVSAEDEFMRMPPEGEPLSQEEIDALRRWIAEGAEWKKHWAFVPPVRRDPPAVDDQAWVGNPIDAFILARLEARDLSPAPPADRRTLARRAYFGVTGLPPTGEQLAAFVGDQSPDAWPRLIDQLLASPHYGEHWARHWLDVVRFAETNSFERDAVKPYAWKYRDYVIRSFNDDKPYDQFVREQLAGDELDEVTEDSIIATGYYRLGTWDDEPADPLQSRYDEFDDIITTTGQGFLGLTVNCARCHDHKIDPIPQRDYYGLLAFFADVTPYADIHRRDPAEYSLWDLTTGPQREQRERLNQIRDKWRERSRAIEDAAIPRLAAIDQRLTETPDREAVLREKLPGVLSWTERVRYELARAQLRLAEAALSLLPAEHMALALGECNPQPEPTHVMLRGSAHSPGDEVAPRFPEIFGDAPPEIPPAPEGARSAGRRRVLAEWIASPQNMLAARVIVNRAWQHHFGRGIVRSANNFGELGTPPTHPELLDWLALWLIDHNWKLKPLHRLILMSNAYKMSSAANEKALGADPANDLFWRFDMRRLSAEELRDAALVVNGRFNPQMFGPGFYSRMSAEALATQSRPGDGWGESPPEQRARRSVYIHVKRSLVTPLLSTFDFPDTDGTCEARFATTQPGQALALLHGEFFQEQSAALADRVTREVGDGLRDQVGHALRLTMGREPTTEEIAEGMALVERLQVEHGVDGAQALRYWCLVAFNLNEFLYLD